MPSEYWDRASSMEQSTNCTERWTTFLVITSLLFRRKLLAPYKRDIITTCWETPNSQGHTKRRTEHNQWFKWGGGEAMHRRSGFSAPITSTLTDLSNFIKCNFVGVTCWSLHTSSSLRAQIQHLPAGCQSNKQFLLIGRRIHCLVRHFFGFICMFPLKIWRNHKNYLQLRFYSLLKNPIFHLKFPKKFLHSF